MTTIKSNLLVKYENVMNEITLSDLTSRELNLFMYLIAKSRDRQDEEIVISRNDFVKMVDPDHQYMATNEKIKKAIKKFASKIDKLYEYETDEEYVIFHVFDDLTYNKTKEDLTFSVNKKFVNILNVFGKKNPFTQFEYARFFQLESKHTKNLYRQLMQWKPTGEWYVTIDEFRFLFGLSKNYAARDIHAKVIKPSIKELLDKRYFASLTCEQSKKGRGGRVVGYHFAFTEAVNDKEPARPKQLSFFGKDAEGNKIVKAQPDPKNNPKVHNFHEREYDYEQLMKEALENSKGDMKNE